jgi:hypothetical protein
MLRRRTEVNAELHRLKAERIERSLARCGDDDWEMKIEAAMLAGTHWVNFVLHSSSITAPDEDVVHNSMLTVNMLRKYSLAQPEMMEALTAIEDLRPCFVRGDVPGGPQAATQAQALLQRIRLAVHRAVRQ